MKGSTQNRFLTYLPWGIAAVLALSLVLGLRFVHDQSEEVAKDSQHLKDQIAAIEVISDMDEVLSANNRLSSFASEASGQITGSPDEQLDRRAQLMQDYAENASEIKTGKCPDDFKKAFSTYLSLVSEEARLLASHPHIPTEDEAQVQKWLRDFQSFLGASNTSQPSYGDLSAWQQRLNESGTRVTEALETWKKIASEDIDSLQH